MWVHSKVFAKRGSSLIIIAVLLLVAMPLGKVNAQEIDNTSNICADVLLVFTRGSGQNPENEFITQPFSEFFQKKENESHSFFNWHKSQLRVEYPNVTYKAVSVHDFPGKYDPIGYKAVGVYPQVDNALNSEVSWVPGDYRASVEHGVAETVGYLKDQIASCPDQSIIVGGYSQGAQVMGDSLFQLTPEEQTKIVGVGLFGDPKYIGSSKGIFMPIYKDAVSFPWRRGDATNQDTGMLEARFPYVPLLLEKRTASYCLQRDMVCAGWSGLRTDSRTAHSSYAAEPMRNTVNELMQWAGPRLAAAERARGGLGGSDPTAPTPAQLAKARDIMFLLNDDTASTVLQTFRYNLDPVLWPITQLYADTKYGAKGYGEGESSGQYLPRVNNIQALLPFVGYDPAKPATSVSNIARAVNARYPFAQPQMGGGDLADPHGLAIEKSIFSGGWRPDAEKHLVLITDRPAKQNYQYNICNATVRSWLQIPNTNGYEACYSKFGTDVWPKVQHPEICETVYLAITEETCKNPLKTPGYTQLNTRTLNDGITAAQSQKIAVSVVVPYKITDPHNQFGVDTMMRDLKYLANATGGTFIYYDQRTKYDQVTLSDTIRQIFGHTPASLNVAYKQALDGKQNFSIGTMAAETNQPIILDVSQSAAHYDQYKWDFNNDGTWDQTTDGPVTETSFVVPQTGFARVLGANTDGTSAETRVALNITQATEQQPSPEPPVVPAITANTNSDGTITAVWEPSQTGDFILVDPATNLPVAMAQLSDGTLTFTPEQPYTELRAYVMGDTGISEPATIAVAPYVPPTPEPEIVPEPEPDPVIVDEEEPTGQPPLVVREDPPLPDEPGQVLGDNTDDSIQPDPTLCYKLQTCNTGSSPEVEQAPSLQPDQTNPSQRLAVATTAADLVPPPRVAAATNNETPQQSTATDDQPLPIAKATADDGFILVLIPLLIVCGLLASHYIRRSKN